MPTWLNDGLSFVSNTVFNPGDLVCCMRKYKYFRRLRRARA